MAKYLIDSTDIEIEEVLGTENLKLNLASENSVEQMIGDLSNLDTTNKLNVVNAINEVYGGLTNLNTYSTTETVIGKYANNKPIYKKTFIGNYQNDATLIGNVDTLVKSYGTASIGGIERAIPYFELYNNNIFNATVNLQSNNVKTSFINNNQTTSSNINITLEYTKTTD